jgi:hypothetical protein
LTLNDKDRQVGAVSVELQCPASIYTSNDFALGIIFSEGRELPLTDADMLEFWVKVTKLGGDGGFDPNFMVFLRAGQYGMAYRYFTISTENSWEHFSAPIGPGHEEEWIITGDFSWDKIKELWFSDITQSQATWAPHTEYFRVDGILLTYLIDVSFLTVDSNPFRGVPVNINGFYGTTPIAVRIEPPRQVTVTVDEKYDDWLFDHWEDGTTTPGRVVDASTPGNYYVIAFYKPPPAPPRPTFIIPLPWRAGYLISYVQEMIRRLFRR